MVTHKSRAIIFTLWKRAAHKYYLIRHLCEWWAAGGVSNLGHQYSWYLLVVGRTAAATQDQRRWCPWCATRGCLSYAVTVSSLPVFWAKFEVPVSDGHQREEERDDFFLNASWRSRVFIVQPLWSLIKMLYVNHSILDGSFLLTFNVWLITSTPVNQGVSHVWNGRY